MRLAVIADIGQENYHVGDEAIGHAAYQELTRRGVNVVMLTHNRENTREYFGEVTLGDTFRFPWPPVDRERYLTEIREVLQGNTSVLPTHDQVFGIIETIKNVDGLLIAGGGNLNSTYGWLLYERAALALIARHFGKKVIISGQTIGPVLTRSDEKVLAELLDSASLVGLREERSSSYAKRLVKNPAKVSVTLDDASFIGDKPDKGQSDVSHTASSLIGTFSPDLAGLDGEKGVAGLAALLDALSEQSEEAVTLLPHLGTPGHHDGDQQFHDLLAEKMRIPPVTLPIQPAISTAKITRNAQVVITNRYHPVIFGIAGQAGVLPIAMDDYGQTRIAGALRHWGAEQWVLPGTFLEQVDRTSASKVVGEYRHGFAGLASHTSGVAEKLRKAFDHWWDVVVAVFGDLDPATFHAESPVFPVTSFATPQRAVPDGVSSIIQSVADISQTTARSKAALEFERATTLPTPPEREHIVTTSTQTFSRDTLARVGIVVRTKDRALLLRRALENIASQRFDNWQAIIVNDGGDPEPVDRLIAELAPLLAGRVRVEHNAFSKGMEVASNQAIKNLATEFIAVHDDDDTWDEKFLETTVNHLDNSEDAGVMVRTEIVWERIEDETIVETGREIFEPGLQDITLFDLMRYNRGVPISFLYRRVLHEELGYFDENLPVVGDWEFNMRVALNHSIGFIGETPLAFWHQRRESTGSMGNSVIAMSDKHRKYDQLVREAHLKEYLQRNGLGESLYLTKYLDNRVGEFHDRINFAEDRYREMLDVLHQQQEELRSLREELRYTGFFGWLKRNYHRIRGIR